MKTWKELREALSMSQRKAVGRRMAQMSKKKSVQMKKARNKMKALSIDNAKKKAQKAVRNLIKQKTVGKSKDLKTMSIGQKVALDKKVDKKMKSMGGKVHSLVNKFSKKIVKQHRAAAAAARSKK